MVMNSEKEMCWYCSCSTLPHFSASTRLWDILALNSRNICIACFAKEIRYHQITEDFEIKIHKD